MISAVTICTTNAPEPNRDPGKLAIFSNLQGFASF